MKRTHIRTTASHVATLAVVVGTITACRAPSPAQTDPQVPGAIALLMPDAIRIVEPFTRWADFDDAPGIDGITVYVQPVDTDGYPVRAVGSMYVELYTRTMSSGDPKGEQLGVWDFALTSASDLESRWNRATQTYELPVAFGGSSPVEPGARYVLSVTYNSPFDQHLSDDYAISVPITQRTLADEQ